MKKQIPGWPGYYATSNGDVLSKATGKPLKWWEHYRTQHRRVRLYGERGHLTGTKGGRYCNVYVHQAICTAFHGPPPFDGALVRHLDGDATNNRPENLAWGTHQDNADDYWSDEECLFRREERAGIREGAETYEPNEEFGF